MKVTFTFVTTIEYEIDLDTGMVKRGLPGDLEPDPTYIVIDDEELGIHEEAVSMGEMGELDRGIAERAMETFDAAWGAGKVVGDE
jgi:hypothetical protein